MQIPYGGINKLASKRTEKNSHDVGDLYKSYYSRYKNKMDTNCVVEMITGLAFVKDMILNSSLIPYNYNSLLSDLWCMASASIDTMDVKNLSRCLYAYYSFYDFLNIIDISKTKLNHLENSNKLLNQYKKKYIEEGTIDDHLNVLKGMSIMEIKDKELMDILLSRIYPYINNLDNGYLSQVIWSMGHIKYNEHSEILDAITARLLDMDEADHLSIRISEVADYVYGFAKLNHLNSRLVLKRMMCYLNRFHSLTWKPRVICRLAWGSAHLNIYNHQVIGKILNEVLMAGKFFVVSEIELLKEALDLMNVEPTDEIWKCFQEISL